jgi:hypothetical protein
MLDEFSTCLNPPCYELLRPEEFQLFLFRFLGKDAGDFYQVSPCIDKGVKGIDFFLGEPLARMMLQACFGQIAVQTYATFIGKCFEIVVVLLKDDADKFGKGHEKSRPGRDGL